MWGDNKNIPRGDLGGDYTNIYIYQNSIACKFYPHESMFIPKNTSFNKIELENTKFTKIKRVPFLKDFSEPLRGQKAVQMSVKEFLPRVICLK